MKSSLRQLAFLASSVFLTAFLLSPVVTAMEQGFYLGFGGNYHMTSGGDFDGEHVIVPADLASSDFVGIDVPQPESAGFGPAGRIGIKAQMWALDFQYSQAVFAKENSGINNLDGNLFFSFFDLNAKYYMYEGFRTGTYLIMGLGYSVMTGEEIKVLNSGYLDTASYTGLTVNLGAGIDFYLTQNIFLFGEYTYRINGYTMAEDLEITDMLNVPFHGFFFGASYAIPQ